MQVTSLTILQFGNTNNLMRWSQRYLRGGEKEYTSLVMFDSCCQTTKLPSQPHTVGEKIGRVGWNRQERVPSQGVQQPSIFRCSFYEGKINKNQKIPPRLAQWPVQSLKKIAFSLESIAIKSTWITNWAMIILSLHLVIQSQALKVHQSFLWPEWVVPWFPRLIILFLLQRQEPISRWTFTRRRRQVADEELLILKTGHTCSCS